MLIPAKKKIFPVICATLMAGGIAISQTPANQPPPSIRPAGQTRPPIQSPASQPRPKPATAQTYAAEQIKAGEAQFSAQCGFCHGRDAAGGESGPDLTRSKLVAEDARGDKIGPVIREGRPNAGMPAFKLSVEDQNAIVAFIHSQMDKFSALGGGRRSVEPEDLATGNAADGRAYFQGAGRCSGCHSPTGDLAGIGRRYQGLALLRRLLYPGGPPVPSPARAIFTLPSGQTITAPLASEDEFSVTILDPLSVRQTYSKGAVKVKVEDPLSAHFVQLGKYTDADMHNIYAYLETLK